MAVEGAPPPPLPPPAEQQQHRRRDDKRQLLQAAAAAGSRGGGSGERRSTGGRTYDGYASLPSGAGSVSRRDFGEEMGEDAYYLESECGGKRREGRCVSECLPDRLRVSVHPTIEDFEQRP